MDKNRIIIYALTAALLGIVGYVFIPWQTTKQSKPDLVTATDTLHKRVVYIQDSTLKLDNNTTIIRTGKADKSTGQYTEIINVNVTLSNGKELNKADIVSVLDQKIVIKPN